MARTDLPSSVATAWGLRQAAGRARPQGLSLRRVVDAGLRLADDEGLAAVSMGRVARELGAATMALYRHVTSKDELVALMVDAAFDEPPAPRRASDGWRMGLRDWAHAHLAVMRVHRWLVQVPIGGPPLMPNQLLWFERGLACLQTTRIADTEKPSVLLLHSGFVRSHATLEADLASAGGSAAAPDAGVEYARVLTQLADRERFPAIRALLDARVFEREGTIDDDFEFGLDCILDGIALLVRTRAARTARVAATIGWRMKRRCIGPSIRSTS